MNVLSFILPKPVLFHPLKHHLGYIRHFIQNTTDDEFYAAIPRIGASQMDLYCGELSLLNIGQEILVQLAAMEIATESDFISFLAIGKGHQNLIISDGSSWTLLRGDDPEFYVHIHPARYARHCIRVKAGVLKTAVMMQRHGLTLESGTVQVNALRKCIGLSAIKNLEESEGIGRIWAVLNGPIEV
ncbi:MAG: hypothetical protein SFV55_22045 [Haliscomenobacter sp.]|uniref:hypothetical protein n=1 Tax=Haliscomenobacter sp. TaxID=2717303 RepID=UPI0029AD98C2|nr:hypothetical protein [Haliscomenobacter sp.]MDX2071127.1 hypothetical protein [Haliscomenobacter sp.]